MALDPDNMNHISESGDPQDDWFVAHWWGEQNILELLTVLKTPGDKAFYHYDSENREIRLA